MVALIEVNSGEGCPLLMVVEIEACTLHMLYEKTNRHTAKHDTLMSVCVLPFWGPEDTTHGE